MRSESGKQNVEYDRGGHGDHWNYDNQRVYHVSSTPAFTIDRLPDKIGLKLKRL